MHRAQAPEQRVRVPVTVRNLFFSLSPLFQSQSTFLFRKRPATAAEEHSALTLSCDWWTGWYLARKHEGLGDSGSGFR